MPAEAGVAMPMDDMHFGSGGNIPVQRLIAPRKVFP
jgi:hypothetical protein